MTVDIFIRTYHKDLEWLKFCLRSIHKFVTGYRQIIICIPENQVTLLKPFNLTQERVVTCPIYRDDYIGQQISKLLSFRETDADYILFIDSDVFFPQPVNIAGEYFRDGKPIVMETPWDQVGDANCWREPTERLLGFETETEKMRRMCIVYRRDTLNALHNTINCDRLQEETTHFSEFNLMGSFAKQYEPDNYYFWHTQNEPNFPPQAHRQYWSRSGLLPIID